MPHSLHALLDTSTFHIWITNRAIHKLLWLMCMELSTAWLLFICCACNSPFISYLRQYNCHAEVFLKCYGVEWIFGFIVLFVMKIVYAPLFTPKICYVLYMLRQTHFQWANDFDIRCETCMRPILWWHTIQITTATNSIPPSKCSLAGGARCERALNENRNKNTNKNTQLRKLIYAKTSFYDNGIRLGVFFSDVKWYLLW